MKEMTIKEFLLEGGRLSMPYKTDPKEWVGEMMIHIFSGGFGSPPKIVVENSRHRDWRLDQIDEAIGYFMGRVFNPDNLMYKENETMRELSSKDPSVDLDDDDNYVKMNRLRMVKVENAMQGRDEYEECGRCDGCGWYEGGPAIQTTCETCGGTGRIVKIKTRQP